MVLPEKYIHALTIGGLAVAFFSIAIQFYDSAVFGEGIVWLYGVLTALYLVIAIWEAFSK